MDKPDLQQPFRRWMPPIPARAEIAYGKGRRFGMEPEMIGLSVDEVSRFVARHTGATLVETSCYEHGFRGDTAGGRKTEYDFEYLRQQGREEANEDEFLACSTTRQRGVVCRRRDHRALEVVSPPLPMPRLADIQSLIARPREAGAKGAGAGISCAVGTQFNQALDAGTILAGVHLKQSTTW